MRLVLSGGGTGGHIIPNIALVDELRERYPKAGSLELLYIGSKKSMEQAMMIEHSVPFVPITCGKLRRYFAFENFVDIFRVPIGILQAFFTLLKFKPDVIFCKGGYVSLPVAVAGWMLRKPVILHESDVTPGLANRLCSRFAKVICTSFEESKKYFRHKKVVFTGNPVRRELSFANAETGMRFLDFSLDLPVLMVMGGSSGAEFINELIFRTLGELLSHYQVVHICGKGKVKHSEQLLPMLDPNQKTLIARYRGFEFLGHELKDVYAAASVIVSRAGAISLAEIGFFNKPVLLIPLGKSASRGDQILNAEAYVQHHRGKILYQGEFSDEEFLHSLESLFKSSKNNPATRHSKNNFSALDAIIKVIEQAKLDVIPVKKGISQ